MNLTFKRIGETSGRYFFYIDEIKTGKVVKEGLNWVAYGIGKGMAKSKVDRESAVKNLLKKM